MYVCELSVCDRSLSLSHTQLSIQLQQSSDYWSQKVRELSIQLEKGQLQTDYSD